MVYVKVGFFSYWNTNFDIFHVGSKLNPSELENCSVFTNRPIDKLGSLYEAS